MFCAAPGKPASDAAQGWKPWPRRHPYAAILPNGLTTRRNSSTLPLTPPTSTGEIMATNPYFTQPLAPVRPRMFNTAIAKVIWTIVPVVTLGLCAAVPFVVAAVKGVVKPWLAITYVVGEIAIIGVAMAIDPAGDNGNPIAGFLLLILIITAATHTALLDSEKINIGK
jgi:hypothetical protein